MQQKNNIIFNFVLCQVRLILFNTDFNTKNYFIHENRPKGKKRKFKGKKHFG